MKGGQGRGDNRAGQYHSRALESEQVTESGTGEIQPSELSLKYTCEINHSYSNELRNPEVLEIKVKLQL